MTRAGVSARAWQVFDLAQGVGKSLRYGWVILVGYRAVSLRTHASSLDLTDEADLLFLSGSRETRSVEERKDSRLTKSI